MSGRKLTSRGEKRRQHLMEAAAGLFADKGYHATSVADIVRHERVGKGVFYWYFSSKEELFCEVLRDALAGLRHAQAEEIKGAPGPLERLERGVRASLRYYLRNRTLFELFQMAATDEAFAPLLRRGQETIVADTVRHVKDGIVEGHIRDADPHVLAHCLVGATTHLMRAWFGSELDGASEQEMVEEAVTFCLGGLRAV